MCACTGPDGNEVPAQITNGKVLFLARVPVGWLCGLRRSVSTTAPVRQWLTGSQATESSLENDRYQVAIDKKGDVSSIFDKKLNRELLVRAHSSGDLDRQPAAVGRPGTWISKTSSARPAEFRLRPAEDSRGRKRPGARRRRSQQRD